MKEAEGTYSQLVELSQEKAPATRPAPREPARPKAEAAADLSAEDLSTTPYISQNYRFTEDELRWLRRQAYNLTERLGAKVSQNTILRVALQLLRDTCSKSPKDNPLSEALSKLKK
ncbi:MAG: hypothetical protein WEC75_09595 [Dehalococcoidia bacterium]